MHESSRARTCGLLNSKEYNGDRDASNTIFSERCGLLLTIHDVNTRYNYNLHILSTNLTLVQKGVLHSGSKF